MLIEAQQENSKLTHEVNSLKLTIEKFKQSDKSTNHQSNSIELEKWPAINISESSLFSPEITNLNKRKSKDLKKMISAKMSIKIDSKSIEERQLTIKKKIKKTKRTGSFEGFEELHQRMNGRLDMLSSSDEEIVIEENYSAGSEIQTSPKDDDNVLGVWGVNKISPSKFVFESPCN